MDQLSSESSERKKLLELSTKIATTLDEAQVMHLLGHGLSSLLLYDTMAIYVADHEKKVLTPISIEGAQWQEISKEKWAIPFGTGILGSVMTTLQGELVNNAKWDSRSVYPPGLETKEEHIIAIPLRLGNQCWGAFAMNRMSVKEFTEDEFETAQFLASYASLALNNIKLINEIKVTQALRTIELEAAVQNRTEEIATQNEELIAQHEEILAQRDIIENHSRKLEFTVKERTIELGRSYDELKKQFQKLEQFSFIVAHNLRSPVARIMGLANIFNQKDLSDKTNLTILNKTVEAARGLDEIIRDLNQILFVQNNTSVEKVNVQVSEFIDGIKNRFKYEIEEAGIVVKVQAEVVSFPTVLPFFDSILTNLFSNAIKYKAQTQPSIVTILFTEGENEYRLIFEDNGLGFDSEKYADKLFQPFQRFNTHTEGKGLGLYLVKSQVDALGATISLTSKSGVGTKVDIVFPKE
jgi:signal transduction histidine kinase